MRLYKDVFVVKGSQLSLALELKDGGKEAAKLYAESTKRYEIQYSAEDRAWFWTHQKRAIQLHKGARRPTEEEISKEAERTHPWLFSVQIDTGIDLSGRQHTLEALQQAEDRLLLAAGFKPRHYTGEE